MNKRSLWVLVIYMSEFKPANVELLNFWADGYVGHTSANGKDTGKKFLASIFEEGMESRVRGIRITSHFFPPRRFKVIRKIIEFLTLDQIKSLKKLHGYGTTKYHLQSKHLNVWYTSENLRPPLEEDFQAFLSHDLDTYDGRNIYLPIWATRLGENIAESEKKQYEMLSSRTIKNIPEGNICAIISNPEPIRMAYISQIQKLCNVDVYGAIGLPIDNKEEVLQKYKFNICFENDEFPGYVTEKPIEAWLGGCIPIWRGLDTGKYLNEDAIINVTKLGFKKSIEEIDRILNDENEFMRVSCLPILQKGYDFQSLRQTLSRIQ